MTTIAQYTVDADRQTGEWTSEPEYVGDVDRAEWNAKQDTDDVHFDTYEHDGETRAVEVRWVD